MSRHIIFYDRDCPFCNRSVRYIIDLDRERRFLFAPLGGETAQNILHGPLKYYSQLNTLVLVENYDSTHRQFWIRSRAFFRIYWLIGGQWKIVGWLSFLPCWIGDAFYRWIAEHRHQFKLKPSQEPGPPDRFLP